MRLLILTDRFPPEDRGGAERIACYHAQAFRDAGWTVGVVTGTTGATPAPAPERQGLTLYSAFRFPRNKFEFYRLWAMGALYHPGAVAAARRAAEAFQPDIVHCHLAASMSLSAATQFAPRWPTLVTFHGYQFECMKGGLYRKRGQLCTEKPVACQLYARAQARLLGPVDRLIAISRFMEERLLSAGYGRERVVYLPNGVPGLELRQPEPLPGTRSLLYVGQLEAHKGVLSLIRAFQRIPDQTATLTIAGDGRQRPEVEALARGDRRIRMTGWLAHGQVREQYRAHRVVVVPSLWHEGMNTVICEAQASARVVVASSLGGNPDLIEDGVSGLLVPAGDEAALAFALTRVLTDTPLAQRLAGGGFAQVQRFSMRAHQDALVSLYQAVLDERG